jgi:hypothetical protein
MSSTTSTIDDRDLTAISYSGSWDVGGMAKEHAGTVTSSKNVGDSFTISFTGKRKTFKAQTGLTPTKVLR